MKRINQNQIRIKKAGTSNARASFFSKPSQRHYTKAGAAILAIIVLHFVSNFIFFRGENLQSEQAAVKPENEQVTQIQSAVDQNRVAKQSEIKDINIKTTPAAVLPTVREQPTETPARRAPKKKASRENRESNTERLRRAEKILTGI
jgi:hypothetical protein